MEKWGFIGKSLRFLYTKIFLRFSGHLIRIDSVYSDIKTNELTVSFHIANKRIGEKMSVAKFVATDMIYLVDPRVIFDIGQQFGAYSEKLLRTNKEETSLKKKCISGLKRVFVDE